MYKTSLSKTDVYIDGAWNAGKEIKLKIDNYKTKVCWTYGCREIRVTNKRQIIMTMSLSPRCWNDTNLYHVNSAYIRPEYQGKGMGFQLYKTLICDHNLILYTNGSQSVGARKLWLRLAKDKELIAYGFSSWSRKVWKLTANSMNTELRSVKGAPRLYGNSETSIMIVKKNSAADKMMKKMMKQTKLIKSNVKKDILGISKFLDINE